MNYIINTRTNYIMYDGKKTIINENGIDHFYKGDYIENILENSCIYYGSTLQGRMKAIRSLINSRYKLPLLISERNNIILFNIKNKKELIWFNFNQIKDYSKLGGYLSIIFMDNSSKRFVIKWSVFNNQILKSSRLQLIYLSRYKN